MKAPKGRSALTPSGVDLSGRLGVVPGTRLTDATSNAGGAAGAWARAPETVRDATAMHRNRISIRGLTLFPSKTPSGIAVRASSVLGAAYQLTYYKIQSTAMIVTLQEVLEVFFGAFLRTARVAHAAARILQSNAKSCATIRV